VAENTFGTTPFYIAAQNGHLHLLQYLLTLPNVKVSAPRPCARPPAPARLNIPWGWCGRVIDHSRCG
jgi:hypothetical protein